MGESARRFSDCQKICLQKWEVNLLEDLVTDRKISLQKLGVNLLPDMVTVRKSATRNVWDKSASRCGDCQKIC